MGVLIFISGIAVGAALLIANHKSIKLAEERERRKSECTIQRQQNEIDYLKGRNKYLRDMADFRVHYEMGVADARQNRLDANERTAKFWEDERVRMGRRQKNRQSPR